MNANLDNPIFDLIIAFTIDACICLPNIPRSVGIGTYKKISGILVTVTIFVFLNVGENRVPNS